MCYFQSFSCNTIMTQSMKLLVKLLEAFGERLLEVPVLLQMRYCATVTPPNIICHSLSGACRPSVTWSTRLPHGVVGTGHTSAPSHNTCLTLDVQTMAAGSNLGDFHGAMTPGMLSFAICMQSLAHHCNGEHEKAMVTRGLKTLSLKSTKEINSDFNFSLLLSTSLCFFHHQNATFCFALFQSCPNPQSLVCSLAKSKFYL